jgi:hypothetical protein
MNMKSVHTQFRGYIAINQKFTRAVNKYLVGEFKAWYAAENLTAISSHVG